MILQEKLLPLRALANLAWAVAVQGNEGAPGFRSQEFFHSLQRELAQRSADLQADSFLMASATASNALEILWASNLAKFQLPTVQLSPIWHSLMHCAGMGGHAGHARPKAEQKTQVTQVTPMAARAPIGTQISKEPRVILQLPDRSLELLGVFLKSFSLRVSFSLILYNHGSCAVDLALSCEKTLATWSISLITALFAVYKLPIGSVCLLQPRNSCFQAIRVAGLWSSCPITVAKGLGIHILTCCRTVSGIGTAVLLNLLTV